MRGVLSALSKKDLVQDPYVSWRTESDGEKGYVINSYAVTKQVQAIAIN